MRFVYADILQVCVQNCTLVAQGEKGMRNVHDKCECDNAKDNTSGKLPERKDKENKLWEKQQHYCEQWTRQCIYNFALVAYKALGCVHNVQDHAYH